MSITKKRSHKNTPRLTAKERAAGVANYLHIASPGFIAVLEHAIQAHARDTLARHKRKHAVAWDRMLAKGAGK